MKQGYVYTIAVIFFTGLLLAAFYAQSGVLETASAQQTRVSAMDDFLNDFERDLDRAAFIAGFRSLIALEQHVGEEGAYLDDTTIRFREAFLNATVENTTYDVLVNSTFKDYLDRVRYEAGRQGMSLDVDVLNVTLYHVSPWRIAVDYRLDVLLEDARGATRWAYNKTFSTAVPIRDLRDPLYAVETNNKAPNTIRTPDGFVEYVDDAGDKNDTTVLREFLNESYYSASATAPSFLMRFSGNLSAHEYGIESLVDLDGLDTQGVPLDFSASLVDYEYFSGTAATVCSVQNMPDHFKLDEPHKDFYEVEGELEYSPCP